MPQKYFALNSSTIKVYGYIDDLNAFMDGKQLMVVPLLSGSGMRVKILEGMASGRTIISSTIGAEGIDVSDGFDILIADDPDAFVRQITKCLTDQENTLRIALNARKTASEKYDKNIVGQQLSDFLDKTADTSA
jgi:glycosyltransferase involved in cell wall biosynthesis